MRSPRQGARDDSQAGAALLEYIGRRRLHQVRQRHQRRLMYATILLGLVAVVLAVSNVVLLNRLRAASEPPPPASVADPPPASVASLPPAERPELAAPAIPSPAEAAAEPVATAAEPVATAPEPVATAPEPALPAAPKASAPAALPTTPMPRPAVGTPTTATAAEEDDPAQRTARWLVRTHGLVEAENRVTRAVEFYSGAEGAFWRRVLLNMRKDPER
jgi:hypothetical protein